MKNINLPNQNPSILINDQEITALKLVNYPKIIEDLAAEMKKAFKNTDKEWKLVEENKNFSIHLKFDRNNNLWSRAEAEITTSVEKVFYSLLKNLNEPNIM